MRKRYIPLSKQEFKVETPLEQSYKIIITKFITRRKDIRF